MRRLFVSLLLLGLTASLAAQDVRLPMKDGSLRFAVLGDTGTGDSKQVAVAKQLMAHRARFPFEFVILMGDNIYGSDTPSSFVRKFEQPYKPLLDAGVKFYASLGNHDDPNQRFYKPFNMNGERYYTFRPKLGVRFFALDSNYMDQKQLGWLEKELAASGSEWKICFFHHPPYSSGEKHGSNLALREQLEPLFLKHGVTVVFTGHEHFYERLKPQKGIAYIIAGNSAKLRRGNLGQSPLTAKGYDQGYTFMLNEIAGDELFFQTISEKGQTIDSGVIRKTETASGQPKVTATGAPPKKPPLRN
jgi:hypothetical protein